MRLFSQQFITVVAISFLFSVSINEEAPQASTPLPNREEEKEIKPNVLVAVVDTGTDIHHPMIKDFLWSNPGESGLDAQGRDKSSNGIDDDTNGFIDDINGWNFIESSGDLRDLHGHGTHISGIITAELREDLNVRLMILKYYKDETSEAATLAASNQAIRYALNMGAHIINYSGGGDQPSSVEKELFKESERKNVFVVAASGNEGRSTDDKGFYPASYGFKNIISVASLNQDGELLPSSNRGTLTVDLAAIGSNVISSLPYGRVGQLTGTSQATAKVSGILAALVASSPHLPLEEIKTRLIRTSKSNPSLVGLIKNPKVPDMKRALRMRDQNEFNEKWKMAVSRVEEVFDDPINVNFDRQISSSKESHRSLD